MEPSKCSHCLLVSPLLSFLFLLPFLSLPQSTEQTNMNMTRGMILSPSGKSYLVSPSGNFAFGFRAYDSIESLFLLAIWFMSTSPQHIIWFAMNQDNPILAPVDSTLRLNQDGLLTLSSSNETQLWSLIKNSADHAALLESGNFVICKTACDDNNVPLWESFLNPTDTIVPGQVLQRTQALWSKLTDTNFAQGRYSLLVQGNNDLVLYPVSLPTRDFYHALWLADTNMNCQQLIFNSNGSLYCQNGINQVNVMSSAPYSTLDYYQHATVDPDGLFRIYAYAKKNTMGWEVIGQNYPDGCLAWNINNTLGGGGICGVNGYCTLNNPNQTRVNCQCPSNYSAVDPNNIYAGCKPDHDVQQCGSAHKMSNFTFVELLNTDWPSQDYEWYNSYSEDQCRDNCMKDCLCAVAIYKSSGDNHGCHKKSLPLQLGIQGNDVDGKVFIKVLITNVSSSNNDAVDHIHIGSIIFLAGASILLTIAALLAVYMRYNFRKPPIDLSSSSLSNLRDMSSSSNLREFTYKELESATKSFQEMLGRGKFGTVFKGVIPSEPPTAIAVKILDPLNDGEREFESEMHSIGKTHHKNLVKLIGFCTQGSSLMLIYDYISKGSLENYIKVGGERLAWDKRAKVALGIAKGLQYLHEDCDPPVIHCDIKPQNILLDDRYVAKISDFGVAKLLCADKTHTSTIGRGTFGYIAPEWIQGEQVTSKVDVYSFGVLLLEIIFCMENIAQQAIRYLRTSIMSQAVEQLVQDLVKSMGDIEDEANIHDMQKFVEVAIACLQADPNDRPTMRDVAYLLSHAIPNIAPTNKISILSLETDTKPTPKPAYGILEVEQCDDAISTQTSEAERPMLR